MRPANPVFRGCSSVALLLLASVLSQTCAAEKKLPPPATQAVDFVQHIQPILRSRCYSCHGAEAEESGLRLDQKRRALDGGDGGKAIVPGNSAESRLVLIVAGLDDDLGLMPPEDEGTPLTTSQIALLRAWIDQGASWPAEADAADPRLAHWSFQPIARPAVPSVSDPAWPLSPIDHFVLARLERAGIAPSPEAPRETLLRRVYLDLLGLPPTPSQVEAFLADERPNAYELMVRDLLASPHFGERWGRHWLDLARYADSDGYEKDHQRPHAWRYREWVIGALNNNMPFDEFTVDQLAGDMLPGASTAQRVASGFHRNTLHNTEGGIDPEEDRSKKTVDRTNTLGAVWLGLTLRCAQCHTHKYDLLTHREYFQLYAFFNNIDEVEIDAPLPSEQRQAAEALAKDARRTEELEHEIAEYQTNILPKRQAEWEQGLQADATVWHPLESVVATSKHRAEFTEQEDGSLLVSGTNQNSDQYTIEASLPAGKIAALRLEVLPHASLAKNGPGRAPNANFVLTNASVNRLEGDSADPIELANARADFSQDNWGIAKAINDNPEDGWAISPRFGQRHVALFDFAEPIELAQGQRLRIVLEQKYDQGDAHNLGCFRLSATSQVTPPLEGLPAEVAAALMVSKENRSPAEAKLVSDYHQRLDPGLSKLRQTLEKHRAINPVSSSIKAQAVAERNSPRDTRIHLRGDFLRPGESVEPAIPALLPPLRADGTPTRLDLARWVVSNENPLTSRVTVNRIWARLFGRGLCESIDDFGTQADPPTHPLLLDWLASEFLQHDWQLKEIIYQVVTSRTYRQSSAIRGDLLEIDPQNELLARQNRNRVDAEIIRDLALATSGLLDRTIGGPSVRPAQPSEYSNLTYNGSAKWQVSPGGNAYRRGLYTFFQRTSPYPMLLTFDAPDSTETCPVRTESNTPLQSLTLWNDPVFFECAQAFGRRIVSEVPAAGRDNDALFSARAEFAFQAAVARRPNTAEREALRELFDAQQMLLSVDPKAVGEIIGKLPLADDAQRTEVAAWVVIARTLMNLDEFITRE